MDRDTLLLKVDEYRKGYKNPVDPDCRPIYEIEVFEYCDRHLVAKDGVELDWPDRGCVDSCGFTYDLDEAINLLHVNNCDMWETCYNYAYIIPRFPGYSGHYDLESSGVKLFFKFDVERNGYFEAEEPPLLAVGWSKNKDNEIKDKDKEDD